MLSRLGNQRGAILKNVPRRIRLCMFLPFTIISINHPRGLTNELAGQVEDFNPDILMLQEAHYPEKGLISGRRSDSAMFGFHTALVSHSNAIYFYNKSIDILEYSITDRYIRAKIKVPPSLRINNNCLIIQSVYAPAKPVPRRHFFLDDGLDLRTLGEQPAILMGDFNDFPDVTLDYKRLKDSRYMSESGRTWRTVLAPQLIEAGLTDAFRLLHPTLERFSRPHVEKGKVISLSRIDHALISTSLKDLLQTCDYHVCSSSDHAFVKIELEGEEQEQGTGRWHLHTAVTTDPKFQSDVRKFLEEVLPHYPRRPTMADWADLKTRIRAAAKKLAGPYGPKNKGYKILIKDIRNNIENIDWDIPEQREKYMQYLNELRRLYKLQEVEDQFKHQHPLFRDEYDLTTATSLPQTGKSNKINCLKTANGDFTTDIPGILSEVQNFFQELYTESRRYDRPAAERLLSLTYCTMTDRFARKLIPPITSEELHVALQQCHPYSAPGDDGLPFELWKIVEDLITPFFQSAIRNWNHPPPPTPFPTLAGTLLFKKGDRQRLINYRPISILNSDLRWYAKAMTNRITPHVQAIATPLQTAFLPKRQLIDSVMMVMLTCSFANYGLIPETVILFLDQEKAYDRVRRKYLYDSMRKYGFPEPFVNTIKQYYVRPTVQYAINNVISDFVCLYTGVLQGDPLAVLLYIISIQPVLDALQKKGVCIKVHSPLLDESATIWPMSYADNLTIPLDSEKKLDSLSNVLMDYEAASNGKVNEMKSLALFPGPSGKVESRGHWHHDISYPTHPSNEEFVELGCPFRLDEEIPTKYLIKILNSARGTAMQWSRSDLSELGRVHVANCYAMSKLWHATQVCPLPPDYHLQVGRVLAPLVFRSTRMAIQFRYVCYPKIQGGLGLIHPLHMFRAMNGKMIARLICAEDDIGASFRLGLAHTLATHGLGLSELVAGKVGKKSRFFQRALSSRGVQYTSNTGKHLRDFLCKITPFWKRIFTTILQLDLDLDRDWSKYSNSEILSVPYDLPGLSKYTPVLDAGEIGQETEARLRDGPHDLCRHALQTIGGITTFRDILFYHTHTEEGEERPHLRLPDADTFREYLVDRRYEKQLTESQFTNIKRGFTGLTRKWHVYYTWLDRDLKARLENINSRPRRTEELKLENRIPWKHLTMAGMPLKEYTVKKARLYQTSPDILQPDWTFEGDEGINAEVKEKRWKLAWKVHMWKDRPNGHYSAYWRLLHRRPLLPWKPKFTNSHDNNPQGEPPSLPNGEDDTNGEPSHETPTFGFEPEDEEDVPVPQEWGIDLCATCAVKDSAEHAFCTCPPVQNIWHQSLSILQLLLSDPTLKYTSHLDLSLYNIVLCFPEAGKTLPKPLKARLTLWHSAVVYTIAQRRATAIWSSREHNTHAEIEWDLGPTLAKIKHEIRRVIYSIYQKAKEQKPSRENAPNPLQQFGQAWCHDNAICSLSEDNKLRFHG